MSVLEIGTAVVIAAATMLAVVLLTWRRRTAAAETRGPRWRFWLLIGLQLATGALLQLMLFPPSGAVRVGTLIVATAGAPGVVEAGPFDRLIALPEAGAVEKARRAPDLASALLDYPGAARVRVVGRGLGPRDQRPLPVPLDFRAPPTPPGLIELAPPRAAAPGEDFAVGGRVGSAGVVELIDPAGGVADRARVTAGGRFVLTGQARSAGLALFGLRFRNGTGAVTETVAVPVETREQARPRVAVLAGAPGAETKFLARWAEAADVDLSLSLDLGGGAALGEPAALTREALGRIDLLVVDDRRWESLSPAAREAISAAVSDGLGLLLRPTGTVSGATRRDWASLGAPLTGDGDARPSKLSPAPSAGTNDTPALGRLDLALSGDAPIAVTRDAQGTTLAAWRARGRGRIGVWAVADSYVLVLAGQAERHGRMWSELFSALARPEEASAVRVEGFAWAGRRVSICGVADGTTKAGPTGGARTLIVDPRAGPEACAAYWPTVAGWHVARDRQGRETAFYVHPAGAAQGVAAEADRQATLAMAAAQPTAIGVSQGERRRGSPWPWFAALLITLAVSWWLERRRGGSRVGRAEA